MWINKPDLPIQKKYEKLVQKLGVVWLSSTEIAERINYFLDKYDPSNKAKYRPKSQREEADRLEMKLMIKKSWYKSLTDSELNDIHSFLTNQNVKTIIKSHQNGNYTSIPIENAIEEIRKNGIWTEWWSIRDDVYYKFIPSRLYGNDEIVKILAKIYQSVWKMKQASLARKKDRIQWEFIRYYLDSANFIHYQRWFQWWNMNTEVLRISQIIEQILQESEDSSKQLTIVFPKN